MFLITKSSGFKPTATNFWRPAARLAQKRALLPQLPAEQSPTPREEA
jgi:hypothetical protein